MSEMVRALGVELENPVGQGVIVQRLVAQSEFRVPPAWPRRRSRMSGTGLHIECSLSPECLGIFRTWKSLLGRELNRLQGSGVRGLIR
jgi:hypothetical protein